MAELMHRTLNSAVLIGAIIIAYSYNRIIVNRQILFSQL